MKTSNFLLLLLFLAIVLIAVLTSCQKTESYNWSYTQQWTCIPNKCQIDVFEITGNLDNLTSPEMSYALDTAKWERYIKTIKDTIVFSSHSGEVKLVYFIHIDSVLVKSAIIKLGKRICI